MNWNLIRPILLLISRNISAFMQPQHETFYKIKSNTSHLLFSTQHPASFWLSHYNWLRPAWKSLLPISIDKSWTLIGRLIASQSPILGSHWLAQSRSQYSMMGAEFTINTTCNWQEELCSFLHNCNGIFLQPGTAAVAAIDCKSFITQ